MKAEKCPECGVLYAPDYDSKTCPHEAIMRLEGASPSEEIALDMWDDERIMEELENRKRQQQYRRDHGYED